VAVNLAGKAVYDTMAEFSPQGVVLPIAISCSVNGLHYIHRLWRYVRQRELYSQENAANLLAGFALQAAVGDQRWLQLAAQCVQIARRIVLCIEQQVALWRRCHRWVDSLLVTFPVPNGTKWPKRPREGFSWSISPSSQQYCTVKASSSWRYVKRLCLQSGGAAVDIFKLSMMVMDAIEACQFDPTRGQAAIAELFVNGQLLLGSCADGSNQLTALLVKNQGVIDKIFASLGCGQTAQHLIEMVTYWDRNLQAANRKVQEGDGNVNQAMAEVGKHALFGFFSALGLSSLLPANLIPEVEPLLQPEKNGAGGNYPVISCSLQAKKAKKLLNKERCALPPRCSSLVFSLQGGRLTLQKEPAVTAQMRL
jgi:hypothetical protein